MDYKWVFNVVGQSVTQDASAQCIVGSPPYLLHPQIIGAEDEYFDYQQEQVSKQFIHVMSANSLVKAGDLLKNFCSSLALAD